jgi:hypothetical protein
MISSLVLKWESVDLNRNSERIPVACWSGAEILVCRGCEVLQFFGLFENRKKESVPKFYGVITDYSQGKTSNKSAPQVLEFCMEDGVDALILAAL